MNMRNRLHGIEDRVDQVEDKEADLKLSVEFLQAEVATLIVKVNAVNDCEIVSRLAEQGLWDCIGELEIEVGVLRMRTQGMPMPAIVVDDDSDGAVEDGGEEDEYVPPPVEGQEVPELEYLDEGNDDGEYVAEGLAIRIAQADPAPSYGEPGRMVLIEDCDGLPSYYSSPEL